MRQFSAQTLKGEADGRTVCRHWCDVMVVLVGRRRLTATRVVCCWSNDRRPTGGPHRCCYCCLYTVVRKKGVTLFWTITSVFPDEF